VLRLRGSNGQLQTIIHGQPKVKIPAQSGWSLYLGDFVSPQAAQNYVRNVTGNQPSLSSHIDVIVRDRHFQARLSRLGHTQARDICAHIKQQQKPCLMVQNAAR